MPKNVEIEIFNIARTTVDRDAVHRWLEHLGATVSGRMNGEGFFLADNEYLQGASDPAFLVALAARRCYMSFEPGLNPNVSRVRKEYVNYFDNILRSRHGSVLEHATFSYAIEGVSRVFTGEMNRHRAGWAISEGSMRFIRFDKDISYWLPTSLRENPDDDADLAARKGRSRDVFDRAFKSTERLYAELLGIWDLEEGSHNFDYKKKVTSCLRRIVPMGVATGGVWTGNVRALRHVIAMRAASAAEEEIFHVFGKIAEDVISREPLMFGDFKRADDGSFAPDHWKV